jgi:hypothetical protein
VDGVWRPAHRVSDLRPAGTFVASQYGKGLRLLRARPRNRGIDRVVCRSTGCKRGSKGGDGADDLGNVSAAALGQPVPDVEQDLRSSRKAIRPPGRTGAG